MRLVVVLHFFNIIPAFIDYFQTLIPIPLNRLRLFRHLRHRHLRHRHNLSLGCNTWNILNRINDRFGFSIIGWQLFNFFSIKLFLFAWNGRKGMILTFNFIYSLRILYYHYQSLIFHAGSSFLRSKFGQVIKSTNHWKLSLGHYMKFDMIIMPAENSFLLIGFFSNVSQYWVVLIFECF